MNNENGNSRWLIIYYVNDLICRESLPCLEQKECAHTKLKDEPFELERSLSYIKKIKKSVRTSADKQKLFPPFAESP